MGRILGIDYGSKRIGLAVTDDLQMLSSPLSVLPNNFEIFLKIKEIVQTYGVEKIVIGYPYSEKYKEAGFAVKNFSEGLSPYVNIEIVFQNEEFSSVYANSFLKSLSIPEKKLKKQLDKYAAQKILQDYLNSKTQ
jgi:putative Holliday junction resolvase